MYLWLLGQHWSDHVLNDRGPDLRMLVLHDSLLDLLLLDLDMLRGLGLNHLLDLELLRLNRVRRRRDDDRPAGHLTLRLNLDLLLLGLSLGDNDSGWSRLARSENRQGVSW